MARLDTTDAQIALRARAITLVACTTGSTTLGQSAAGFTRSSGSFISDGFKPGMEVSPSGFLATDARVLTNVTSGLLTVRGGLSALAEASGRTLAVGLPETRKFENRDTELATDIKPFVEEEYVPRPPVMRTMPAQGATLVETGEWVLRWYGLTGYDIPGLRKPVDALLALFTPGTRITAGAFSLRVQGGPGEPGPFAGTFVRNGNHMVSTIRIPVEALAINVVAA